MFKPVLSHHYKIQLYTMWELLLALLLYHTHVESVIFSKLFR